MESALRFVSVVFLLALSIRSCSADDAVKLRLSSYTSHVIREQWIGPRPKHTLGGRFAPDSIDRDHLPTGYPSTPTGRKMLQRSACPAGNPLLGLSADELALVVLAAFVTDEVAVVALAYCAGLSPSAIFVEDGASLLIVAVANDAVESALFLIAVGANVNHVATDPELSALGVAAAADNAIMVQLLIDGGANLEVRQTDGSTPLDTAAIFDSNNAARVLIAAGSNIEARDDFGLTPLMTTAIVGSVRVMRVLLQAGAFVNATDGDGLTALHFAASFGQVDAAAILVANGASTLSGPLFFTPFNAICITVSCSGSTISDLQALLS